MRRCTSLTACWLGWLLAVGHAQQSASSAQRVFRAGVDVVLVDASVLDKNRRPVRGLTAADFTVLVDGGLRPVVAFTPVELPDREASPPSSWIKDVTADVATNSRPEEGRLVVIMMDRSIPTGQPMTTARRIALAAVDQLAPGDLAAVVYTGNYSGSATQNFTADRARLVDAINTPYTGDPVSKDAADVVGAPGPSGECYCGLCVLDSITHVADAVRDVPQRRKILFFIGTRIVIQAPVTDDCSFPLKEARTKMFSAAQVANLTIHTLDPTGLETNALTAGSSVRASASTLPNGRTRASAFDTMTSAIADNNERQNTLGVLGQQTGGRTVFSGPAEAMPEIFRESQSYYLLGFRRADDEVGGQFHRIEVKVNRPGVEVRTRQGYFAPAVDVADLAAQPDGPSQTLMDAMRGVLPQRDLPLSLTVAPFAVAGRREAAVALVLAIRQRAIDIGSSDRIEVIAAAVDREGRSQASERRALALTLKPNATGDVLYEVPSRFDLAPGRYEIRISAESAATAHIGSVYMSVDVPDFAHEALSLSGVVLESVPAPMSAATGALITLMPVSPTTLREFGRADRVTAFLQVYQGGNGPEANVQVTTRLTAEKGRATVDASSVLDGSRFGAARAADYRYELPTSRLATGQYLMTVEAMLGKVTARREVRFRVK